MNHNSPKKALKNIRKIISTFKNDLNWNYQIIFLQLVPLNSLMYTVGNIQ